MHWNLRMIAAQNDIWRPTQLLEAFKTVGFTPSLSKVAALWSSTPVTVRLEDLDFICAALGCTIEGLMQPEPMPTQAGASTDEQTAVGAEGGNAAGARPVPGSGRGRRLPPN